MQLTKTAAAANAAGKSRDLRNMPGEWAGPNRKRLQNHVNGFVTAQFGSYRSGTRRAATSSAAFSGATISRETFVYPAPTRDRPLSAGGVVAARQVPPFKNSVEMHSVEHTRGLFRAPAFARAGEKQQDRRYNNEYEDCGYHGLSSFLRVPGWPEQPCNGPVRCITCESGPACGVGS